MNAVLKVRDVLDNVKHVVAIELISAAQAVDLVGSNNLGNKTRETYDKIRKKVLFADRDREFAYDLETIYNAILRREI
jgi:histidine ammonia-lyase